MSSKPVKAVVASACKKGSPQDLLKLATEVKPEIRVPVLALLTLTLVDLLSRGKKRQYRQCAFVAWLIVGYVVADNIGVQPIEIDLSLKN